MSSKQISLRVPVGLLEAIDARRDGDNDRTSIIISLLSSALTGEYIEPKENNAIIINKLVKKISSLEQAIKDLASEGIKQNRMEAIIDNSFDMKPSHDTTDTSDERSENLDLDVTDNIYDSAETEESDNIEALPLTLTHSEFFERFGSCEPTEWEVELKNGEVLKLSIMSADAIIAFDSHKGKSRMESKHDVVMYRKILSNVP
jgi:hypothetical protein